MTKTEKALTGMVIVTGAAAGYFGYEHFSNRAKVKKFMKENPQATAIPNTILPKSWTAPVKA